jgi:hypothetical protein
MGTDSLSTRAAGCVLAAVVLVVGVWYAAFGLSLLLNLGDVTARWIVASRDPDFHHDAATFRGAGALLALLALGLGVFSIRAAGRTFVSRYDARRHWLLLTGMAVIVSLLRGLAELIAGVLTPLRVASFGAVCGLYVLLWLVDRTPPRPVPRSRQRVVVS